MQMQTTKKSFSTIIEYYSKKKLFIDNLVVASNMVIDEDLTLSILNGLVQ